MTVQQVGLDLIGEKYRLTFQEQRLVVAAMHEYLSMQAHGTELNAAQLLTIAARILGAHWNMSNEGVKHAANGDAEFNYMAVTVVIVVMGVLGLPEHPQLTDWRFHFGEGLTPDEIVKLHELDDVHGRPATNHHPSDD